MKKEHVKKLAVVAVIIGVVVAFKVLGLGEYLTLGYLKESQASFQAFYEQNSVMVVGAYMGIYVVVTALSLPGAAVMTLAGGALFGLAVGTVAVSFASSIGATLACFVARFLLRDWVQKKVGQKLGAVHRGIEREGALYLFTMRLIPVFPFWMINLVMGLTKMPLRRFYWVSQVGMLPGTLVYVNAGKELGQIESLSGILSPGLIFSFVLLGVFPLAAKKLMALYRKKKGLAPAGQGRDQEQDKQGG